MSSSNISQDRVARLPLSSGMVELLGNMMTSIDQRFALFQAITEGNVDSGSSLRPSTCDCCRGLGFILTLPEPRRRVEEPPASPIPDDDDLSIIGEEEGSDSDDDAPAPAPGPSVGPIVTPAVVAAPVITPAVVAAPVVTPAVVAAPAPVVTPAVVAAPAVAAPAVAAPAPAPVPVAMPAPTAAPTAGSTQGPQVPAMAVPAASPVVPGLNSLPANTPPPLPASAVYCQAGAGARYYTVTRGIRVGVYEGWQNVAPYVIGVANASYSRHGTIMGAYEAYVAAYTRGFVSYT